MTQSQQLLLLLLERALQQHHDNSNQDPLPLAADTPLSKLWTNAIAHAEYQQVSGVAFDALPLLPKQQQPDKETTLQWTVHVCSNERNFYLYTQQCLEGLKELNRLECTIVLMKGLLLAQLYPKPEHRPIGDVDLYIEQSQLPLITKYLKEQGAHVDEQFDAKHVAATFRGLYWEFHFKSIFFFYRQTDKRYQQIEKELTLPEALCTETICVCPSGENATVQAFPPLLEILYLTAHIQHHLLLEEIYLRHVVDWMLALHHNRTALAIAESHLIRHLQQLKLYRLYRALGYIGVTYLGFENDSYAGLSGLAKADKCHGEYLLKIILQRHVPGCKPYQAHTPDESWATKTHLYIQLVLRCFHLLQLIPQEALAAPIGYLVNTFYRNRG